MPADPGDAEPQESPAVAAFLAERRADVLRRAIETLETCSTADLAGEAHRLAGTLGVFGLDEASAAARALMAAARSGPSPDMSRELAATLEVLRGNAASLQGRGPG